VKDTELSERREISDEELCARIRGYWLGVPGGHTIEVSVADGETVTTTSGHVRKTGRVVSNLWKNRGMPPGVRSFDVPRSGGR
jgi:hypothetical protein